MNQPEKQATIPTEQRSSRPRGLRGAYRSVKTFLYLWMVSRPYKKLAWGLPALAVLVGVPVLSAIGSRGENSEALKRYRALAVKAAASQDHEAAELWWRKVVQLDPQNLDSQFYWSEALRESGRTERANRILIDLANRNHVNARLVLAQQLTQVNEGDEPVTPDRLRKLIGHFEAIAKGQPADSDAAVALTGYQLTLARLLLAGPPDNPPTAQATAEADQLIEAVLARDRRNADAVLLKAARAHSKQQFDEAIALLQRIVPQRPDVRFLLAQIRLQQRDQRSATEELEQARDFYAAALKDDPQNVDARLLLARAHASLGDLTEAAQLVEQPLPDVAKGEKGESDPKLVDAWMQLCISQVGAEIQKPEPDWARILSLLDLALTKSPNDPRLLAAIAVVVSQREGEGFDRLRSGLEEALADGRAPATCHLVLGTAMGVKGELDAAISHLRAASKSLPDNPLIANNLAMFLLQLDPAPLDEALELANLAVEKMPNIPHVLDTRGQVLYRLERYDEALPDLEAALKLPIEAAERHLMLADIYERRGESSIATRHRERAEALASTPSTPME